MIDKVRMEISGGNSAEAALKHLKAYTNDETVESVVLEIKMDSEEIDQEIVTQSNETIQSSLDSEEELKSVEQENRQKGDIRSGTSHHRVLYALTEINDGNPVSGKLVKEHVDNVAESSIYPALTQLWERKLADRERVEDVPNPYYKYEITEYGKRMLSDLGKPKEVE